jgi:DNA-binding winged helix-turn-helix (wHTH) protein
MDDLLKESTDCFSEAVNKDRDFRLEETNMPIYFSYFPEDTANQITIEREGYPIIYKEKTDSVRQLSNVVMQNHAVQTVLLYENPINVNMLDSLFRTELQKKKIKAQTVIQHTNNTTNKTYYSHRDSLPKKGFDRLPEVIAGVDGEITLRAFVKLSPASIVRNTASAMGGVTFAWIILMSVFIYLALKKEKVAAVTEQPERNRVQFADNLYLEADRNCLIYKQKEIKLTGQYTQFLSVLFNCPDHFAGYEELIRELYGEIGNEAGKERLSQLAKRIRTDVFTSIPEVELKNVPRKGYKVILAEKNIAV